MKRKLRIIALVLAAACAASFIGSAESGASADYGEKLDTLAELIREMHINADPKEDPIRRGLIRMFEEYPGTFEAFANVMYQSYDPYSYYVEPEVYDAAYAEPVSGGIGITLVPGEGGCVIDSVQEGTPAESVGILKGDILIAADGINLRKYTPEMVGGLVTGDAGTQVRLTLLRGEQELSFTLTRAPIKLPRVTFEDMGGGVAYIRIADMAGASTFLSFCGYYDYLEELGFTSVVLDLRDNPGGDLDCLINMMDEIIPDKDMPYLMVRGDKNRKIDTYTSEGYGWEFCGMYILVNENTGSAAELLAGGLQDLGYAEAVGVQTMGKGLGQAHLQLKDGSYAVISTHEMLLPVTGAYTGRGIYPKHYVQLESRPQSAPDFEKLDPAMGVYRTMSKNVLGTEQRLKKMGYFDGRPDTTADEKTFHAINMFQKDHGMEMTPNRCDAATLRALNAAYLGFIAQPKVRDTQLEKAVALAKAASARGKKPQPIDPKSVRFTK